MRFCGFETFRGYKIAKLSIHEIWYLQDIFLTMVGEKPETVSFTCRTIPGYASSDMQLVLAPSLPIITYRDQHPIFKQDSYLILGTAVHANEFLCWVHIQSILVFVIAKEVRSKIRGENMEKFRQSLFECLFRYQSFSILWTVLKVTVTCIDTFITPSKIHMLVNCDRKFMDELYLSFS